MSAPCSASTKEVGPPDGLQYVFVISRHARRTPIANSRNLDQNAANGHGDLTEEGRQQAFQLGQFIRARYKDFLRDASRKPGELLATHVGNGRCRDSVEETVRGVGISVSDIEVDPTQYDQIIFASMNANFDALEREPCQGPFSTLGEFISFIAEKTGTRIESNMDKCLVVDNLMTHVLNGNPVPGWAKHFWDDIQWADRRIFQLALQGQELSFANYGLCRLIDTLSLKFERGIERPDKVDLYCASDAVVSSTLRLLNQSYDGRPCFCASVFFEVYKNGSQNYVRVLFSPEEAPHLVALDELDNPCEMSKFLDRLRTVLKSMKST